MNLIICSLIAVLLLCLFVIWRLLQFRDYWRDEATELLEQVKDARAERDAALLDLNGARDRERERMPFQCKEIERPVFTDEERAAIAHFYKSEEGQKFLLWVRYVEIFQCRQACLNQGAGEYHRGWAGGFHQFATELLTLSAYSEPQSEQQDNHSPRSAEELVEQLGG